VTDNDKDLYRQIIAAVLLILAMVLTWLHNNMDAVLQWVFTK